jgi:PIN domain nuclease of toxin-antitoxin system
MALYVTDTHALLWSAGSSRLSRKARRIFDEAEAGHCLIYIPLAVLWETTILIKNGDIALSQSFDHWSGEILSRPGFDLAPLDLKIVSESLALGMFSDPFDCIIVATARVLDLPLITADRRITESRMVEVIW